ncbi:MAG: serine/threonine-protein kinase, partial [Beijerinckiaceae bacterium]
SNILQRPTGEMVFIDFGLSRHDLLPDLLAEEFTIPMGTYPYIAPEQVLGQRNDLRSDIFALGAMMYELATGKLPFGEPARMKQLRKRFWRDPVPPRKLAPAVPEWLQEIILRALEVDPALRYQSAAQLRFDLLHPEQVIITGRGRKRESDPMMTVFRRWRDSKRIRAFAEPVSMAAQIDRAPIIMVAVDLSPEMESLADRLLFAVKRMLVIQPDARIACANVLKTARLGIEVSVDAQGNNLHVQRLVGLKHWARSLDLPEDKITFSVLENSDPAEALIEFARTLNVDHILMGARGHSTTRRFLGSVSSQVVAEAPCSVTVIRIPEAGSVFAAREAAIQDGAGQHSDTPADDPRTRESSQAASP